MPNTGIVMIATTSRDFIEMSLLSCKSLRKSGYEGPITVFTDLDDKHEYADFIKLDIPNLGRKDIYRSRWIKTKLNLLSPYDKSLYIDVDIITVKPFPEIWDFLNQNKICLCPDQNNAICDVLKDRYGIPTEITYFNGGLILWEKSTESDQCFSVWHEKWLINKKTDQIPFSLALLQTGIRPLELPAKYNTFLRSINTESVMKHVAGGSSQYKIKNMN